MSKITCFYIFKKEIENTDKISALINVVIPAGAMIGAMVGGLLASIGRRKSIIILDIIILLGVWLSLIKHLAPIMLGRLIFGFGVGSLSVIGPKFINELCPIKYVGPVGSINQIQAVSGLVTAYLLSMPLPYSDEPSFLTTDYWRFIYFFPTIPLFFQLFMLVVVFRWESPAFYIEKGKAEKAEKVKNMISS